MTPEQLDRAIAAKRRRRVRLIGVGGVAVCLAAAGTAVVVSNIGSSGPASSRPLSTAHCPHVPHSDAVFNGKVKLDITVRAPVKNGRVPIAVHWSAPGKTVVIDAGLPILEAYVLNQDGAAVARIDPKAIFAGVGSNYDIAAGRTYPPQSTRVEPLTTCSGSLLEALPRGRYRMVIVDRINLDQYGHAGSPSAPFARGTVVSAPASIPAQ